MPQLKLLKKQDWIRLLETLPTIDKANRDRLESGCRAISDCEPSERNTYYALEGSIGASVDIHGPGKAAEYWTGCARALTSDANRPVTEERRLPPPTPRSANQDAVISAALSVARPRGSVLLEACDRAANDAILSASDNDDDSPSLHGRVRAGGGLLGACMSAANDAREDFNFEGDNA